MKKDLVAKISKTESKKLAAGVVRDLDDAELASIVGGMMIEKSPSCSGGCADDCCD